ncbi:MAG TPA: RluA family pseudouridine synthase [Elusimicrobiota bacterium]|nr:RluA family pseudouridine synthase [Elusimicrobiota bacterium]
MKAPSPPRSGLEFTADWDGVRLDVFLAQKMPRRSRGALQEMIRAGQVEVDGAAAKPDRRLRSGERVSVSFPKRSWLQEFDFESRVIFEDKHLLIFDKPAALLMHPARPGWLEDPRAAQDEASPNFAGLMAARRPEVLSSGVKRCGVVHRLDAETSGIFVAAKTEAAWRRLTEAFEERSIEKAYRAVVRGQVSEQLSEIDAPVGRLTGSRRIKTTPFGRPARTALRLLETFPAASYVEAKPLTGRTHQIRAHLSFVGHPVAGDIDFDRGAAASPRPPRLMLHAYALRFAHPISGKALSFRRNPPGDFSRFLKICREGRPR